MNIRYIDPDSPEGRAMAERARQHRQEMLAYAEKYQLRSLEGLIITPNGPISIDEDD